MNERSQPAQLSTEECPACGGPTQRIEVDIGVGIQYGPRHCMDCVWQEPEEDLSLIDEPDGECFRGGEAAGALAESQAWIQRNLK